MKKDELGISRKFANGTVHENATGMFMIMDRYLGEDNKPWLKFQWLSGTKVNGIEENKEENVNATLHKFKTTRGIKESSRLNSAEAFNPAEMLDRLDNMQNMMIELREMTKAIHEQGQLLQKFGERIEEATSNRKLIESQQDIMSKLVEKM